MSVESISIALHHSRATGTAKLILVGIANHDGDGGAWPSMATLARYAGVTARNAQKAITRLEELGEIRVHQQQGGNSRTPDHIRPNLYEFVLTCAPDCDRTKNHRSRYELPDPLSVATPPVGSDTPPLSVATPEPSFNHSSSKSENKAHGSKRARDEVPRPKPPRYTPPDEPLKPVPWSKAEAEAVAQIETLDCPATSGRFRHWLPSGQRACVRCLTDLDTLTAQLPEEHAA